MGITTLPSSRRDSALDGELARDSMLLISLGGALAVTAVVAVIAGGPAWMAAFGILVALLSVVALMGMFLWLVGDEDENAGERR